MNPRYPASARYRRHRKGKPLLRLSLVGVLAGGGLLMWFLTRTPEPVDVAEQAQKQANRRTLATEATRPAEQTDSQPENKQKDKAETLTVIRTPERSENRSEEPLEDKPKERKERVDNGSEEGVSFEQAETLSGSHLTSGAHVEIKANQSVEEKEPEKAGLLSEPINNKTVAEKSPPLIETLQPKVRKPGMKFTFYEELPEKQLILPGESKRKVATPPPLVSATHTQPATEGVFAPEEAVGKLFQQKKPVNAQKPVTQKPVSVSSRRLVPDRQQQQTTVHPQKPRFSNQGGFLVQVATFANAKGAISLVDQLRRRGGDPRVLSAKDSSGRSVFQVRIGPFPTYSKALQALRRWKVKDHSALIVPARR